MSEIKVNSLAEEQISTTWNINVQEALAAARNPIEEQLSIDEGTVQVLGLTANKDANFTWYINGSVAQTNLNIPAQQQVTYDFEDVEGVYSVEVLVVSGTEEIIETWIITVTEPSLVISVDPVTPSIVASVYESIGFSTTANRESIFEWYLNGTLTQTDELVTSSTFNYVGSSIGTDTVEVLVTAGTKSDSFTWTVTVEPTLEIIYIDPVEQELSIFEKDTVMLQVGLNKPGNIHWYIDGIEGISQTGISGSFSYKGAHTGIHTVEARATIPGTSEVDSVTWTINVFPVAYIQSVTPSISEVSLLLNDSLTFSATSTGTANFEWYLNGTLVSSEEFVGTSSFPYDALAVGTEQVEVRVISGEVTHQTIDSFIWTVTVESLLDFSFIDPLPPSVEMIVGIPELFLVTTNKVANFSWTVDGAVVSTDTGVSSSQYTFNPTEARPYTLQVVATSGTATLSSTLSINALQEPTGEVSSIIPVLAAAGIGLYLIAGKKKK